VVEQTIVMPPPVTYAQPPVVYAQPNGAEGAYDANAGQATYNTYDNTGGGGVVSTEVPAGVGGTTEELSAEPQYQTQQQLQQPAQQQDQPQPLLQPTKPQRRHAQRRAALPENG
jgi:hypothetical protein